MLVCRKKQKRFNILQSKAELKKELERLPNDDECFKLISNGGFSSISFAVLIAEFTKINNLYVSSFGIGKKEIQTLHRLKSCGKLDRCTFQVFSLMKEGNARQYWDVFEAICKKNGWDILCKRSHSKVHLYDTEAGKFVLETSSNLNENPKIEQFSFEKDSELYDFYLHNMFNVD